MRAALTIARRELGSYFRTPAGWVIVALYVFLTGVVFARYILVPGSPASLRDFFAVAGWLLLPVAPAISMRLVAEELRAGTIEPLLSAPVSAAAVLIGKYLGAFGFLVAMLAPTGLYVLVLDRTSSTPPDIGPVLSGYVCLLLVGGLFLGLGTLASTLTSNATLAFMVTLFLVLGVLLAPSAADFVPAAARPALYAIGLTERIGDFAKGVIDTAHIVFFLTGTAWCLVMGACVMELRRWR